MYCDYNATAPLRPAVREVLRSAFDFVGNPSSIHKYGQDVRSHMEKAREKVATFFGSAPKNVIFTSGATEANNMVLRQHPGPVLVSAIEHDSVYICRGDRPTIEVHSNGLINLDHLKDCLKFFSSDPSSVNGSVMIAVMAANNETGVIQPLDDIFDIASTYKALVHVDAVQAIGKHFFDYARATTITLSGHKLGALAGIGALIKKPDYHPKALIEGGGQERGFRSGTENMMGILSLGAAITDLQNDDWSAVEVLRDRLEAMILDVAPEAVIFGKESPRLQNTINIAMPFVKSDLQLMLFDQKNIAVSSGSACSSGKVKTSRVLKAMKAASSLVNHAIRISFGTDVTEDMIHTLFTAWSQIYKAHSTVQDRISTRQEDICQAAM